MARYGTGPGSARQSPALRYAAATHERGLSAERDGLQQTAGQACLTFWQFPHTTVRTVQIRCDSGVLRVREHLTRNPIGASP